MQSRARRRGRVMAAVSSLHTQRLTYAAPSLTPDSPLDAAIAASLYKTVSNNNDSSVGS